ncbi:hypothetical protein NP233_g2370 [Leucocoprinus birnbaumii]|uniref:RING-type domain-containing protein n=1 Tax=Leucocoprinus birnbaumii TaxID=56174 RepID=A0AAD5W1I5_9AGAR|nr:hypothetical protein NP233_g2370 [Leucocoprinus birnbaumii]
MSSREPMWYCHECHAEMRPLMVPDPSKPSLTSSLVQQIEDPSNDPRDFAHAGGQGDMGDGEGIDNFLGASPLALDPHTLLSTDPGPSYSVGLQTFLNRGMQPNQQRSSSADRNGPSGSRVTFQIRSSSTGPRTYTFGSSPSSTGSPNPGSPPTMSEFIRAGPPSSNAADGGNREHPISGQIFAQYLLSLLGQTEHPMLPMFLGGMPENGRMGDYVFSQEALDQIITQIMENSNSHRPVPATEEIVEKLPREVLVEGSPLLSKDCAVCKDQFQLATEDPDEQIVIELPCKHPFHQPCILPWLKSSGTCPVCRYALVPQPDQNTPRNNANPSSTTSPSSPFNAGNPFFSPSQSSASRARSQSPLGHRSTRSGGSMSEMHQSGSGGGLFTHLFRSLAGQHGESSTSPTGTSPLSSPPSSPYASASGPTRTREPFRRHTHRASMDSSVPFAPSRSSTTRQHSHSQQQNQNQSPDGGRGGSGSRGTGGSSSQDPRPHVPGQWDDMMDLD